MIKEHLQGAEAGTAGKSSLLCASAANVEQRILPLRREFGRDASNTEPTLVSEQAPIQSRV